MGAKWIGTWSGGRIRQAKDGKPVFVLEKVRHGRSYSKALHAGNEEEALAELALFERDPAAYRTRSEQLASRDAAAASKMAGALLLDEDAITAFLNAKLEQDTTKNHVKNLAFYLSQWSEFYAGRDIRTVPRSELTDWIRRTTPAITEPSGEVNPRRALKRKKVYALRAFTHYLRTDGKLAMHEDPTLGLTAEPGRPEKAKRVRAGGRKYYELRHVERLYSAIVGHESQKFGWKGTGRVTETQSVRDVLLLQAKHGMHATEVERLAKGQGHIKVLSGHGEIAGTIQFVHKVGHVHVISVDAQSLAAAQRLQKRGSPPVDSYIRTVIGRAAKMAEVESINFGTLRHSFATWAKSHGSVIKPTEGGVSLEVIAAVMGHRSTRTTKLNYDGTEIPEMIKIPLKLEHPEDPLPLVQSQKAQKPN